jgi:hypothetical protein
LRDSFDNRLSAFAHHASQLNISDSAHNRKSGRPAILTERCEAQSQIDF